MTVRYFVKLQLRNAKTELSIDSKGSDHNIYY